MQKLMTISEVAKYLGVSKRTVYNYMSNGDKRHFQDDRRGLYGRDFITLVPTCYLPSGEMRFSIRTIKNFLKRNQPLFRTED